MGFRCEVCDSFLSLLQLNRLCDNCYKVRTIAKCYSSEEILDCLEKNFKVNYIKTETAEEDEEEDKLERPKSAPLPSNDTILPQNFKKELEDKVIKQIETRQQKKLLKK